MTKLTIAYILFGLIICNNTVCFAKKDLLIHEVFRTTETTLGDSIKISSVKKDKSNLSIKFQPTFKLSVYTPVLPFIDCFSGFSYRAGAEFNVYSNFSAYIEGGGFFYNQPKISWLDKVTGGVGKIGFKYYFANSISENYIAIDYLYKKVNYTAIDSIRISQLPTFQKEYNVQKEVSAFSIKYGEVNLVSNKFLIDIYAGIGIRFINAKKDLTETEINGILSGEGNGGITGSFVRYSGIAPSINVGIKIGFVIID